MGDGTVELAGVRRALGLADSEAFIRLASAVASQDAKAALELVAEKNQAAAQRLLRSFEGSDVQVLRGRYGPYISDGKKNAPIPKPKKGEETKDPATFSLDECLALLAKAPARKSGARKRARKRPAPSGTD